MNDDPRQGGEPTVTLKGITFTVKRWGESDLYTLTCPHCHPGVDFKKGEMVEMDGDRDLVYFINERFISLQRMRPAQELPFTVEIPFAVAPSQHVMNSVVPIPRMLDEEAQDRVRAAQRVHDRNVVLEDKNATLRARVAELEGRVKELEGGLGRLLDSAGPARQYSDADGLKIFVEVDLDEFDRLRAVLYPN